ncbi:MAG: MFS transporter [Spirochaetes bacterium]|nr:MFS transporter [Spirochaetota bacterium]
MQSSQKAGLTGRDIRKGLKYVILDGLATQVMITLTGGVFLVGFALKLGASNIVIGLLAAIPPLTQLIQIPGIYFVEKFRKRKIITVSSVITSRLFWFIIAAVPLLFAPMTGLTVFMAAFILNSIFAAFAGSGWSSWMRDLIPQNKLGVFFSKRMKLSIGLSIPLSLAAGFYLDHFKTLYPDYQLHSYSMLFFLGFLAGVIGALFISRIPEPEMAPAKGKIDLIKLILDPFKDLNFKNLIIFLGSWNFAVNLAAPFFTVYMLNRLGLNLSVIIILSIVSQVFNFLFLNLWGRYSDRYSNKSILMVSGPLFMLCILAWTFTTMPDKYFLTVPLLIIIHIFSGISTAGVSLATGNISMKLAPKGRATSYLAANSVVNSVAASIAPIIGGLFAHFFSERELSLTLNYISPGRHLSIQTLNLQQWDFFFVLAFIIGLYSIHRLSLVKETGEVQEKIVVNQLISHVKRNIENISSVAGIRNMIQFPFLFIKIPYRIVKTVYKRLK